MIENAIRKVEAARAALVEAQVELDQAILNKFLVANGLASDDAQFEYSGKTIGQIFVVDGKIKGYPIKKDGLIGKTHLIIKTNEHFIIL